MKTEISVTAYTTGQSVPSARYRVRQLIPFLSRLGIDVNEIYSKSGAYPPKGRLNQVLWAFENVSENLIKMVNQPDSNIVWLQKPLFSKLHTFERFLKKPLVFDVDDAIFLGNSNEFAGSIAKQSTSVICGNNYLANYFSKFNSQIDIIPTAVDVSSYDLVKANHSDTFQILWTGTSSNYKFLYSIELALKIIKERFSDVTIKIVSNELPKFKYLSEKQFVFEKWTPEIEFSSIKNSNLGIMPIFDDEFSKGKCSYKMLCYMAGQLPVIVSPYGMNEEVLNLGRVGYGAKTIDEWVSAIEEIYLNGLLRSEFGKNGREIVLEYFDVNVVSDLISKTFKNLL